MVFFFFMVKGEIMDENEVRDLLVPVFCMKFHGCYPMDIRYRKNKLIETFRLRMPDHFIVEIPIYEGENKDKKIFGYIEWWYFITKIHPNKFDHIVLNEKCPVCGGKMSAKLNGNYYAIWCMNFPACTFHMIWNEEMFRKHEQIKKEKRINEKIVCTISSSEYDKSLFFAEYYVLSKLENHLPKIMRMSRRELIKNGYIKWYQSRECLIRSCLMQKIIKQKQ